MKYNPWLPELTARLGEMVAEGATFAAIGAELGITKNQAIGKAQRMGFGRRPDATLNEQQQRVRAGLERKAQSAIAVERTPNPFPGPGRCVFPDGHPGTPEFRFCGERARAGGPYCDEHHRRAYAPVKRDVAA